MSGGSFVVRRAPQRGRSISPTHSRAPGAVAAPPAHRAEPSHRRGAAVVGVLAALGGAAVTAVLLLPGDGLQADAAGNNTAPTDPGPSPVAVEEAAVTCWDGSSATVATKCGVPSGRAGLATVFPSLDGSCAATAPVVGGKAEVFTCRGSDYVIRYTRWRPGFDRFAVFSEDNHGLGSRWTVGREFAGRRWASREQTGDGARHYKWTATYRAQPFSVEVQATSLAGRSAGMASVRAVSARHLGRE